MTPKLTIVFAALVCWKSIAALAAEPLVMDVWPGKPPAEIGEIGEERAEPRKPDEKSPTLRITNVTRPTLSVFRPERDRDTGAAVVICPGGGHRILAWDKEGTEVAEWLTTIGVTGIVLKYRVPARHPDRRWLSAVQDTQRAVSLVRSRAKELGLDPERIGLLGFSAGGEAAALTALSPDRHYESADEIDRVSSRPDFAILIYPAYLVEKDQFRLRSEIEVTKDSPPMFLAHAHDDGVTPLSSVLLYTELKRMGVTSELHVYASGGHGFGLRPSSHPSSTWPKRCEEWLKSQGWLVAKNSQ